MRINPQEQRIDQGTKFAKTSTPDFSKLYYKYNPLFLKLLTTKINKKSSKIADFGGGNAILAKQLVTILQKKGKHCAIDIIDFDQTKKIKNPKINFIEQNVLLHPHTKEYYDYAISRHLIHYFDHHQLKKFLKNVYSSLKPDSYFLLVNWVIDDAKIYQKKKQILRIIQKQKNISLRTIPISKTIINSCKNVGFIISKKKKSTYSISINDFYKNRFQLSRQTIEKIITNTKIQKHKESQLALLLRKPPKP